MSTKVYTQQEVKNAIRECLHDNEQCMNFYEEQGDRVMQDMYWSACEALKMLALNLGVNLRGGE